MNVHHHARLTPHGRERIVRQVESGQAPPAVAKAAGVYPRTVRKWVDRYRARGSARIAGSLSPPHRLRRPTPPAASGHRRAAPPALDRQAGRRQGRRLAGDCQPGSIPSGLKQA